MVLPPHVCIGRFSLLALLLALALGCAQSTTTTAVPPPSPAGETLAPPAPVDSATNPVSGATAAPVYFPAGALESGPWTGRLIRYQPNLLLLTVRGTPAERGTAHGTLLKPEIQRLIVGLHDEIKHNQADPDARFTAVLAGARKMKPFLEPAVQDELTACAAAAQVEADELLLVQLYGDVNRAEGFSTLCSTYAAFGPATADHNLQFGRNLDYPIRNLDKTTPLILQELPTGENAGRPFVTVGFAGVISGWTAMNADGLCAENNTLFGGDDSEEGLATCFMVRKLVERAATVEAAQNIIETTPRACTTAMLVAGRNAAGQWDARLFEFDHSHLATKLPARGLLWETNTCQKLAPGGREPAAEPGCARYQKLKTLLADLYGQLDYQNSAHNLAGREGVYLSINLHCAWLNPATQELKLAVAPDPAAPRRPAAENPFHHFKITATAIVPQQ